MTAPANRDAIPRVETFILQPPGLDVALRVSIAQAVKPLHTPADGPVAVIYATDADYHFGSVIDAARMGGYGSEVAPAVVVGIGYANENGDLDFVSARRFTDFYSGPRRSFNAGAYGVFEFGGADAFLAALRDHVIPFVEGRVARVDPTRRVLLGTSAGGHFAAYALAQAPGLFHAYALMSPVLGDPQVSGDDGLVRAVAELPDGTFPVGTRVFLSAGSREEDPGTMFAQLAIISNAHRMRAALVRHGVATDLVQFADETHVSVSGAAISRALRFLLPVHVKPDWQAAMAALTEGE
jgi:predicted alpha/beta superfamily hydrolase